MHLYAFIAILVPKLVAMVTPLCPCVRECQRWIPDCINPISKPNSVWICRLQVKLWPFCDFLAYFGQNWLPWQRPLDPCNQKCLLRIGRPRKPPVISNHVLAISHRNAFICIYSNFSPKIGCNGNAPLSLVYGSVKDEFPDYINPNSKPNSVWISRLQLKLWPFFVIFWPILAKIGCHGNAP